MTKPVCPHCQLFLIELENLDFKCEICKRTFELVHAGFILPIVKEIK